MQFTLDLLNQFLEDMHEYSTVSADRRAGGVVTPMGWAMGEEQVDCWGCGTGGDIGRGGL